ncbi:unnamed protein product [Cladocopium goreaui]|uniref:Uncharacterized protein n=1 Tax=Cladocopium goreaui TaxID=2562237 RepID=A0A9P1GEP1_9DINO|nr:unnamed protein product [Cladocopium goreaui]
MNCLGLAKEWESNPVIRDRLRSERKLLVHGLDQPYCKANRKNCVSNADVLGPVLSRLGKHPKKRLPHMDALQLEVGALVEKCGITSLGGKSVYKHSMELKQLAGLVKRKANRHEDPCFHDLLLLFDPEIQDRMIHHQMVLLLFNPIL